MIRHIAGIIPIMPKNEKFNLPFHECLLPIGARGYLAIEKSVIECASMGCRTIWIILPERIEPLIRAQLGDYVEDIFYMRRKTKYPTEQRRRVPIYYVRPHPRDAGKRDSIVWNILEACRLANEIGRVITSWVVPERFYITSPYGVNYITKKQFSVARKSLRDPKSRFIWETTELEQATSTIKNLCVCDGKYTGFSIDASEVRKFRQKFKKVSTGSVDRTQPKEEWRDGKYPTRLLPPEERWSGRWLKMKDIFTTEELFKVPVTKQQLSWSYNIDTWRGYRKYLTQFTTDVVRRPNGLLKNHTYHGVAREDERDEDENEINSEEKK